MCEPSLVVDSLNGWDAIPLSDTSNLYIIPGLNFIVALASPSIKKLPPDSVTTYPTIIELFSAFIVLLVSVCESSKSTSVASDTAVFNCASVDVTVLLAKLIPLFVSVCEPVRVATVLSIAKLTLSVLADVSIPVPPSKSNVA